MAHNVANAGPGHCRQSVPSRMKNELSHGGNQESIEERNAHRIRAASARARPTERERTPLKELRPSQNQNANLSSRKGGQPVLPAGP